MENSGISSIAVFSLQTKTRILKTACCPDKDLVVLITRVGNADRISLWKMQGSKKWEVDVARSDGAVEKITAMAWSPDGETIVLAHSPPRISFHSLQDGHEERSLTIPSPSNSATAVEITGVWWFPSARKPPDSSMPDIFNRGGVITGSAHSILRMQPLLDALQEENPSTSATELFAFQGVQGRSSPKSVSIPSAIASWPALPPDLLAASIQTQSSTADHRPGEELDEIDRSNVGSLLVVIDNAGQIHSFWDGSYSLGVVRLAPGYTAKTIIKHPSQSVLYVTTMIRDSTMSKATTLVPITMKFPLMDEKMTRKVAETSTTARELVWYTMRIVKQMRKAWFGGDGSDGAREANASWVRSFHERQAQFGQQEANAVLDLTALLTTGRPSEALADFIVGEQMSERALQKWETTVGDALVKLRIFSEKRVAPAFQRLHLVLEEVHGWSMLPQQYSQFEFSSEDITTCLELAGRGIVIAAWLATTAQRELIRFKEFISFLRFEASKAATTEPQQVVPKHDILEVNSYLMSGLVVSSIDKWFIGPVPKFTPKDLTASPPTQKLAEIILNSRRVASDASQIVWPPNTHSRDLSHLDRNLDALIQALAEKCALIFDRASRAVAKKADLDLRWSTPDILPGRTVTSRYTNAATFTPTKYDFVCERTVCEDNEFGDISQHLAICAPYEGSGRPSQRMLCMIRASHRHEGGMKTMCKVGVALLECTIPDTTASEWLDVPYVDEFVNDFLLFDMDFFDDQHLVILYHSEGGAGQTIIGMVKYSDLGYQEMDVSGYVRGPSREDIVTEALKLLQANQIPVGTMMITKSREVGVVGEFAGASIAVNGRAGRRVAYVCDTVGLEVEVLDMEGED